MPTGAVRALPDAEGGYHLAVQAIGDAILK